MLPTPQKIPLSRVHQSELIDRRILQVVKGGNYILGPECKEFESELAAYFGVKYAVLSSSWTAAVHLLHIAQGIQAGDEILVPSLTAFPSIEPMIHVGAKPVFCDIDETYTIDLADAAKKITKKTVGILPVHLYGRPANIDDILNLAGDRKLWVIEDCAQSHGAKWKGRRLGSFGNHAAISFYPSKNLTVYGDGGAVLTNDAEIAQQVTMLRNHGRKDKYLHEKIGFNLRFNEIQAAVGREQLKVLDELNAGRRRAAKWYRRELAGVNGVALPLEDSPQGESVYHMFVVRLDNHDVRESLARHLKEKGIETGVHYPVPNHLQPAIQDRFGKQPALPRTEDYVKRILSLPMYPSLSEAQVATVSSAIKSLLATK
ncbi:MAG TPA: DegT/DnrJ/EryC1/StrS family aminotransferase [Tepidisphaeraceae bacterium]|jgi:dTDP-4-amino-4,6-dideoxygalactose transaminase|nr:DegT/DnrJ/EryC1/StrS family aminotransferase [Tepidisphaeraceae bacterium]